MNKLLGQFKQSTLQKSVMATVTLLGWNKSVKNLRATCNCRKVLKYQSRRSVVEIMLHPLIFNDMIFVNNLSTRCYR